MQADGSPNRTLPVLFRAESRYGLTQAYILQDLLAWNPAVWDRYTLSDSERAFAKVRCLSLALADGIGGRGFLENPVRGDYRDA